MMRAKVCVLHLVCRVGKPFEACDELAESAKSSFGSAGACSGVRRRCSGWLLDQTERVGFKEEQFFFDVLWQIRRRGNCWSRQRGVEEGREGVGSECLLRHSLPQGSH